MFTKIQKFPGSNYILLILTPQIRNSITQLTTYISGDFHSPGGNPRGPGGSASQKFWNEIVDHKVYRWHIQSFCWPIFPHLYHIYASLKVPWMEIFDHTFYTSIPFHCNVPYFCDHKYISWHKMCRSIGRTDIAYYFCQHALSPYVFCKHFL